MPKIWAAVFLAALAPRLADLGRRPFWYNEVVTLQRASLPLGALLRDALAHHHLPAYFLMVSPFATAHDPQFWLRLPSAICGALAVALAGAIASRAAGLAAGLAAAIILGLSPTAVAFSQDARDYAVLLCLVMLALHGLVGLALAEDTGWRRQRVAWISFTGGTAAALCVSGDALPWWLAANLGMAWLIQLAPDRRTLLRRNLVANAFILAIAAPCYLAMMALQQNSVADGFNWLPRLTPWLFWHEIFTIYLMRVSDFTSFRFMPVLTPAAYIASIAAGLAAACAIGLWRLRARPALLAALSPALLLLPVFLTAISFWHPVLLPRYIFWSAGPFAIFAGIGISVCLQRFKPRLRFLALGTLAAVLAVNLLPFYPAETKARWNLAARLLAAEARPDDVLYLYQWCAGPTIRYYLPAALQPVLFKDWRGDLAHASQARAAGHRVWVVYGDAAQTTSWMSWPSFSNTLTPLGSSAFTARIGTRIFIRRYDPPASPGTLNSTHKLL